MNLKIIMLSKRSWKNIYILCDPITIKFYKIQTSLKWLKADQLLLWVEGKVQERGVTKGQRELLGVMDMFLTLTEVIVSWICIYVCQNLSNYAFQMSALYYVSISKKMLKIKSTCVKNLNTKLKKKFENKKLSKGRIIRYGGKFRPLYDNTKIKCTLSCGCTETYFSQAKYGHSRLRKQYVFR